MSAGFLPFSAHTSLSIVWWILSAAKSKSLILTPALANLIIRRHVRVDYGLHRASQLHRFPFSITQRLPDLWKGSYDNYCIWTVNKTRRFATNYPDDLHLVEGMSGIVPIVHIRNHKDDCWYLYGGSYQHGAGRFTGETAELMWPFLNGYAGQTRQMSPGYRHDFINLRLNDWNWLKAQRNGTLFSLPAPSPLNANYSQSAA
jgi:hypothetical protein